MSNSDKLLKEQIELLQQILYELQKINAGTDSESLSKKDKRAKKNHQNERLQTELKQWQQRYAELEQQYQATLKANEHLQQTLEDLQPAFQRIQKENQRLLKAKDRLQNDLEQQKQALSQAQQNIQALNAEQERLQSQLRAEKNRAAKLAKEKKHLQAVLEPVQTSLALYQPKSSLAHLVKTENELYFLSSWVLNFDALWDYANDLNREHKDDEFQRIKTILEQLFPYYAAVSGAKKQEVNRGDRFDIELHSRDNRSPSQTGSVQAVVLFGYIKNQRLLKKSIVKVG